MQHASKPPQEKKKRSLLKLSQRSIGVAPKPSKKIGVQEIALAKEDAIIEKKVKYKGINPMVPKLGDN